MFHGILSRVIQGASSKIGLPDAMEDFLTFIRIGMTESEMSLKTIASTDMQIK